MVRQRSTIGSSSGISRPSQLSVNEDSRFISLRPLKDNMQSRNSGLRPTKSLNALDSSKQYDVKVGYSTRSSSRKIPPIGGQNNSRGKMVTIYRNGDRFFGGTKVAIHSERYFKTLGNLQDYLTQRLKIPQGVRYIFTINGRLINDINEMQDGESYVASGVKAFQEMDYGSLARLRTGVVTAKTNSLTIRPDDAKLYRSVSPEVKKKVPDRIHNFRDSGIVSLPGSRESCVITVVNNYDHSLKSRVLLNLRTNQTFEDVLEDMGQSVKIKKATRLLTPWGDRVRGFSHLRNDLYELETFYIDCGDVVSENSNIQHAVTKRRTGGRPRTFRHVRSNSSSKYEEVREALVDEIKQETLPTLRIRIHDSPQHVNNYFQR